ncbi:short chain dehydrogenase [Tricladium varicosporioides]|nr:short chain dehydrogenase [Hymenoscyphus varicosporioides]
MSRYAAAHQKLAGPGDSRPTALQIIEDEGLTNNMKDKVFLITGCSSGIGIETGRAIASTGAKVYLAVRSLKKGQEACKEFLESGRVELLELDTSSLASVRKAAEEYLSKESKLNVLICNAGIMLVPEREESIDGFEIQTATNYLGHFLLFQLLKNAMLAASTPAFNSRLVNVSSAGHHASEIQFDDFNLQDYTPSKGYSQSKLAQIYQSNYIDRHFGSKGIHALSLMPGGIATNLQRHIPDAEKERWAKNEWIVNFMKSSSQGAATTVLAAVGREWEGKGGKYLEDCGVAKKEPFIQGALGVRDYAYDEDKEDRLWKLTLKTLGLNE